MSVFRQDGVEHVEILDYMHASEHVWQVAGVFFGEGTLDTHAWVAPFGGVCSIKARHRSWRPSANSDRTRRSRGENCRTPRTTSPPTVNACAIPTLPYVP